MPESPSSSSGQITHLLLAWREGESEALDQLMPLVYQELRRLARRYMKRQQAGHTLQTTALVNEAYLRLVDSSRVRWQNRAHFFAVSAQLMRRILVDIARKRRSVKGGGEVQRVSLDEGVERAPLRGTDLIALDDALKELAQWNPRHGRVVELRYFGGLSEDECAEVLGVSTRTVRRDWSLARAWLYRSLSRTDPE